MSGLEDIIPYERENVLENARSRYTTAFEGKPVFDKLIQLFAISLEESQDAIQYLKQDRTLDRARGRDLDILGRILYQPRILVDVDFLEFFGMVGHPRSHEMGDLFTNSGGMFFDLNERLQGSVSLDDETYRMILRAKIAKNSTRATPEDLMWYLNFVFGTDATFATESNAVVIALISENLTPQQVLLLSYVNREGTYDVTLFPKPIGVSIEYGFYDPTNFFGFEDMAGSKSLGDLDDPTIGGVFAGLYQFT